MQLPPVSPQMMCPVQLWAPEPEKAGEGRGSAFGKQRSECLSLRVLAKVEIKVYDGHLVSVVKGN